jgi:hypothetical protein
MIFYENMPLSLKLYLHIRNTPGDFFNISKKNPSSSRRYLSEGFSS